MTTTMTKKIIIRGVTGRGGAEISTKKFFKFQKLVIIIKGT